MFGENAPTLRDKGGRFLRDHNSEPRGWHCFEEPPSSPNSQCNAPIAWADCGQSSSFKRNPTDLPCALGELKLTFIREYGFAYGFIKLVIGDSSYLEERVDNWRSQSLGWISALAVDGGVFTLVADIA